MGCNKGCKSRNSLIYTLVCGERGIRTPGPVKVNGFQDRRDRPLCHLSSVPPNGAKAFVPISFAKVIKVMERGINFPRKTYIHFTQKVYTYRTISIYLLLKRYISIGLAMRRRDSAVRQRWREPFTRRMKLVLSKGAGSCGAAACQCGSVALRRILRRYGTSEGIRPHAERSWYHLWYDGAGRCRITPRKCGSVAMQEMPGRCREYRDVQ